MPRYALAVAATALAILVWLPLQLAGVPLDTPDGFLHLGWAAGWARQIQAGDFWPQWSDLNWSGAGSFALAIYPPLFRLILGAPLAAGVPPDQALAGALLVVFLVNAAGAVVLAETWKPKNRFLLVLLAGLNPYLLVNVYVRGAWPESLALAWLWWIAAGLANIEKRQSTGILLATTGIAGVVLSNWNSALLTIVVWGIAAVALSMRKAWMALRDWTLSQCLALVITAPFWWPALQLMPSLRAPVPEGLLRGEFFMNGIKSTGSFGGLLWVQGLAIALLLASRWFAWGGKSKMLGGWGLCTSLGALLLCMELMEPVYEQLPVLQRIQFPWRWLGPAWFGGTVWICAIEGERRKGRWRLVGAVIAGIGAIGCWVDGLWRFRTNIVGHAPSRKEVLALREILKCSPYDRCPKGASILPEEGELAKRFAKMDDGRISLAGVPDYTPAGIPTGSWEKRLAIFWIPKWPQAGWAEFSGEGLTRVVTNKPRNKLIRVNAQSAGVLRVMQWAHPHWRIQRKKADGTWEEPLPIGGKNGAGWIEVPLEHGVWDVALTYGRAL